MIPTLIIKMPYWLNLTLMSLYFLSVASCVIVVLKENRNPIRSLAWVIALIFLPVGGLVFYLFFGRSLKGMRMISRHSKRRLMDSVGHAGADYRSLGLCSGEQQLVKLAYTLSKAPLTVDNKIDIFTDGEAKFNALKKDLRAARTSIYLQYYIFADDTLGNEIADILMEKARAGVTVKVIYDHVGSFSSKKRFFNRMRDAGVDVHPFFRVTFRAFANRINWRNHRKLVVIDRSVAYLGGMNIADRYANSDATKPMWRDTHFRLQGQIVDAVTVSFAIDWAFMGQKLIHPDTPRPESTLRNSLAMQLVTSGPTNRWDNLSLCFLQAIANASKSVYIQTPYFLPTDSLLHALQAAALAKVDVRIMIPARSDSVLLNFASFSYVTQCLNAGIKVYLYTAGMLHAKTMIIDDTFVTAGSTNFDFRSFENNFECNLFIYDADVNRRMRDIYFRDLRHCVKLTYNRWHKRPLAQRLAESVVRLLAPIL